MADYGSAATGAMAGGMYGSSYGPVGTAVGAVVGGAIGLFGGKKKKKKAKARSTLDPTQRKIYGEFDQGLHGEGPFADLYNYDAEAANANFEGIYSRPAYRSFQENIVPQITGQFRGGNIQNSSYAGQALARAGRDVQEGLDARRADMIYQGTEAAKNRKFQGAQNIMNMQTQAYERRQSSPGVVDQILSEVGPAAGEWFADWMRGGKK